MRIQSFRFLDSSLIIIIDSLSVDFLRTGSRVLPYSALFIDLSEVLVLVVSLILIRTYEYETPDQSRLIPYWFRRIGFFLSSFSKYHLN